MPGRVSHTISYNSLRIACTLTENMSRIFSRSNGKEFDYVFNCGGETRYSQEDEVYRVRSHALSLALGHEAAKRHVKCFIEVSTGMVYKPDPSPRKENAKLKPWLKLAKWKLTAEEDLAKVSGLNLCILRLANVYGPYTSKFLATALCLARVYQSEEREMKWLWDEDLRTNTVHVEDAARALWTAAGWYGKVARLPPPVFNIVDHGNTCEFRKSFSTLRAGPQCLVQKASGTNARPKIAAQGTLASIINEIFSIPTGFQGTLISQFARMHLDSVVDDLNDETLDPWADLQGDAGITQSNPIGPFVEKELLKDTDLSMDGSAFIRETGFQYVHDGPRGHCSSSGALIPHRTPSQGVLTSSNHHGADTPIQSSPRKKSSPS